MGRLLKPQQESWIEYRHKGHKPQRVPELDGKHLGRRLTNILRGRRLHADVDTDYFGIVNALWAMESRMYKESMLVRRITHEEDKGRMKYQVQSVNDFDQLEMFLEEYFRPYPGEFCLGRHQIYKNKGVEKHYLDLYRDRLASAVDASTPGCVDGRGRPGEGEYCHIVTLAPVPGKRRGNLIFLDEKHIL